MCIVATCPIGNDNEEHKMSITKKLGLIIGGTLAIVLTACGSADQIKATVPDHPDQFKQNEPGTSLMARGYTPAVTLFDKDGKTPNGVVYVDCSADPDNIAKCANDIHNRGTAKHPNVYTVNGKVTMLEGQHDSGQDDRSYRAQVPESFQDFGQLTEKQKTDLITNTMPAVADALGAMSNGQQVYTVPVPGVGNVEAQASRD